ncbi:MAG: zinc ribbon domain-containing protein [Phycisphaerae bacterium]
MALVECPECGKEISNKALICPHCGFMPLFLERILS